MNSGAQKRIVGLCIFFSSCYLFYLIALFLLQIIHVHVWMLYHSGQSKLADPIHAALRGTIRDRWARVVAYNVPSFAAVINPQLVVKDQKTVNFLATYFPDAYEHLAVHRSKKFMYVKRQLTDEQVSLIKNAALPNIQLIKQIGRCYPFSALSCVVGNVDVDQVGIAGIENNCNESLQRGDDVSLTVDAHLQFLVYEELMNVLEKFQAKQASAIIMDPAHGEILSLISVVKKGEKLVVTSKVVTDSYEPGSVMKIFSALAALQDGVVQLEELIDCHNARTTTIDGRVVNTWRADGLLPFSSVIAFSNNIGIALVAKRLGERLYDHYVLLGFGQKTGIELPGEHGGAINHPDSWSKQSLISLSYGYEILVTPLQLAAAFATIANGGYAVQPHLVKRGCPSQKLSEYSCNRHDHCQSSKLYSDQSLGAVQSLLRATSQYGTARSAHLKGFELLVKTGSANMLDATGHYCSGKNIFTCAGIVKKDSYQRVVVACVQETARKDLFASQVAVPLFERLAQVMVVHEGAV